MNAMGGGGGGGRGEAGVLPCTVLGSVGGSWPLCRWPGWVALGGLSLSPGLADLCSLPLDFYHSKRRLIFSKRRP